MAEQIVLVESDADTVFTNLPGGVQHNIRTLLAVIENHVLNSMDQDLAMNHLAALTKAVGGAYAQRDEELRKRTALEIDLRTQDTDNAFIQDIVDDVTANTLEWSANVTTEQVLEVCDLAGVAEDDAWLLVALSHSDWSDMLDMPERYADVFRRVADVLA